MAITLASEPGDKLVLTVRNDGVPFAPPASPKGRMGLRIMNYRANTVGATFDIRPNQKNGTIVTCVLPVRSGVKPHRNGNGNGHGPDHGEEPVPEHRLRKHRVDMAEMAK